MVSQKYLVTTYMQEIMIILALCTLDTYHHKKRVCAIWTLLNAITILLSGHTCVISLSTTGSSPRSTGEACNRKHQ